jgi:6-phosphogluconolactonase (cycloisomerase 2 family)
VWRVRLDAATGALSDARLCAELPAPSFIAVRSDGTRLYAVGEDADGSVSELRVVPQGAGNPGGPDGTDGAGGAPALELVATVPSGGADPCHLVLAPDERTLYIANYSSGTLAVFPLDAAGGLPSGGPAQVHGHRGSGPVTDRQEGPHAHFAALAPGGAHVLVCDLGTDEIRRYRRDAATGLVEPAGIAATFAPGAGPRHIVFSADGRMAYVSCELDVTVVVLAWDPATATGHAVQTVPAAELVPGLDALPSHITIDHGRVLVATRGVDVLAELAAGPDGLLAPVRETRLPGAWPRHFAVVHGWTVVADQRDDSLTTLRDGVVASRLDLPAPACVVER